MESLYMVAIEMSEDKIRPGVRAPSGTAASYTPAKLTGKTVIPPEGCGFPA